MNYLNKARLQAKISDGIYRGNYVRQDPAVVKSGKQAGADVKVAARSVAHFAGEVHSAWGRAARD